MVVTRSSSARMLLVPSVLAPLMVTPVVANSGDQELVGLARPAVGIGDDVGDEQVVVADVPIVVSECPRPLLAMLPKEVEAHHHSGQGGGHVVGGAAHVPVGALGPGFHCPAPRDQLIIGLRELPTAVDPLPAGGRLEGHQFQVVGRGLEIVQRCGRPHGVAVGRVVHYVRYQFSIEKDLPPIAQAVYVLLSLPGHCVAPKIALKLSKVIEPCRIILVIPNLSKDCRRTGWRTQ